MSNTDIRVGVFNVLAAGVSACTLQKNEAECNEIYEAFFNVSNTLQQDFLETNETNETYTIKTFLEQKPSAITAFFKKNNDIKINTGNKADIIKLINKNLKPHLPADLGKVEGTLGGFLKKLSQKMNIALFGGFLLGNGETVRKTVGETDGQLPLQIIMEIILS